LVKKERAKEKKEQIEWRKQRQSAREKKEQICRKGLKKHNENLFHKFFNNK